MDIKSFINNTAAGNAAIAKENLNDLLSARAFKALDESKTELAQNLFGSTKVQEEELNLEDYSLDDIEKIKKFCFDKYPEISEEIIISELGIKEGVFNLNTIIGEVVKQIESNTLEISYE